MSDSYEMREEIESAAAAAATQADPQCDCGHPQSVHFVIPWNEYDAPCHKRDELGRRCRCQDYQRKAACCDG